MAPKVAAGSTAPVIIMTARLRIAPGDCAPYPQRTPRGVFERRHSGGSISRSIDVALVSGLHACDMASQLDRADPNRGQWSSNPTRAGSEDSRTRIPSRNVGVQQIAADVETLLRGSVRQEARLEVIGNRDVDLVLDDNCTRRKHATSSLRG